MSEPPGVQQQLNPNKSTRSQTRSKFNKRSSSTVRDENGSDKITEDLPRVKFMKADETVLVDRPENQTMKAYKTANGNLKLTWTEEDTLYKFNDQGPFVIHMENIAPTEKPISDIKIGKLMILKRIKDIIETKRIGRNRVKITFSKKEFANQLLKDNNLAMENLKAFIPSNLVQRIGIIKFVDDDLTNDEIKDNIYVKNIKIKEASRFMKTIYDANDKSNVKKIPTGTVKIIFAGQLLPEVVELYGAKRKVSPYYFSVTQCFGCYRFGHTQKMCKAKKKCRNCGENLDDDHENCTKKIHCVNCNMNHSSTDKTCEERKRQEMIKRIMVDENISFFEANEKFPKISNRFEILEHLGDFPELPVNRNYHRGLENHKEDTYKMYNNYKQKKLTFGNHHLENRNFSQLFVEDEIIPSSPIKNNPYRTSDFEKFRNEIKNIKSVFDNFYKNDMNKGNPANNDLILIELGEKINKLAQFCINFENNLISELPSSGGTSNV